MNPVGLYAQCSTVGTTVILVVYLLTNLSAELLRAIHAVIEDAGGVLTSPHITVAALDRVGSARAAKV
jgi:hypothetical protein